MEKDPKTSESAPGNASAETASSFKEKLMEIKEVPEALDFLREHGAAILAGAGVAAVLFLGWSLYRNHKIQQQRTAAHQLFTAQSIEQIQDIANRYKKTPIAPLAKLVLAGEAFDQGQYDYAYTLFTQFVQEHPTHDFRDQAAFSAIQCIEASGRFQEAFDAYGSFVAERPGHYLAPAAKFARARCLEQMGRLEEARDAYEAFLSSTTDERWQARAESAIAFVNKEIRARARGQASPSPAGSAPAFNLPAVDFGAPTAPAPNAP